MQSDKTLFSVVIPHLNQTEDLNNCLTSLAAQSLGRSQFEVIVVDNGSTVPPDTTIARHPGVRLLQELSPGPGLARNRGALNAAGDILAFIDADCRAHPDWLRNALAAIKSLPERSVLGGDVQIWRDGNRVSAVEAYEIIFAYRFQLYIERDGFAGTGNLIVRRDDFNRIGPFAGISVAEDIEWGQRARAAGFTFRYVPDAIVYHPARRSLHELLVKWDRHIQHYLNMARGTPGWRIRWIARAVVVLVSPAIDFMKVMASDQLEGVSARCKAVAVLIAVRVYRAWRMVILMLSKKGVIWNREKAAA
jgi:GT2 family glycosyltransferase